ncbi:MAG: right-handed parallel beta-helix repeat-containing protein [Pirellulaceae bacterium]
MLTTYFVDGAAAAGGTGGPNDPFDTIQKAIVAAEASNGPDSVHISSGIYNENLVIEDSGKLTIQGNGATVKSAAGDEEHTIEIDDSAHITIRDLVVVDGDDGIRADNVGSLKLVNVQASGNDDEGVQAEGIDNLTLIDVDITGNGDRGVDAEDIGKIRLVDANLSDNADDGLRVVNADDVQIIGGTYNGSSDGDGIDLEVIASIDIRNITASNNSDEGLEVDDSGQIKVMGGNYNNNGGAGLDIDDTLDIRIAGIAAIGNGDHGLQIEVEDDADDDDIVVIRRVNITNSVFSNNVGDGIQIMEEDGTTVEDVKITNVVVANNTEFEPGDGGHGLFIDISGELSLRNVTSEDNDVADVLP